MAKLITTEVVKAIQHNLEEFGYSGLTIEFVAEECNRVLKGETTGIIGMFAKDMLRKGGYLEEA